MKPSEKMIDGSKKPKASRNSFGEVLAELGEKNSKIVVLDADLSKSTQTQHFAKKFPDRFFNMGIAEANMIGTAAGLSMCDKIPYAASFACFLTGRYDQIRMSVAASAANVRLIGTHAGVGIGEDGHSQMGLEDLGLMRSLPNMTVLQPADDWETRQMVEWTLEHRGPVYFRLTRQNLPNLKRPDNSRYIPGKWGVLNPEDLQKAQVLLFFSGGVGEESIKAADLLAEKGVTAVVINASWLKPFDEALLQSLFSKNEGRLAVSVEDHYTIGGLGTVLAENIASMGAAVKLLKIGVEDFGQSGSPEDNMNHYGLVASKIASRILKGLGTLKNS